MRGATVPRRSDQSSEPWTELSQSQGRESEVSSSDLIHHRLLPDDITQETAPVWRKQGPPPTPGTGPVSSQTSVPVLRRSPEPGLRSSLHKFRTATSRPCLQTAVSLRRTVNAPCEIPTPLGLAAVQLASPALHRKLRGFCFLFFFLITHG